MLAADTGVTQSDLAIWREHLGGAALERFVVLNKIDALADPLLPAAEVQAQIERQCRTDRADAGPAGARVFPLSAREALSARVSGDAAALRRSRLPALEAALAARAAAAAGRAAGADGGRDACAQLRDAALRRLGDRRRQNAEQMLELRGLRGKSGAKVRLMLERVEAETAEFERCTARLAALRAVQARQLRDALAPLSSEHAAHRGRCDAVGCRRRRPGLRCAQAPSAAVRSACAARLTAAEAQAERDAAQMLDAQLPPAQRRVRLRVHDRHRARRWSATAPSST